MHDLATINRLNSESFAKDIQYFADRGKWVVSTYSGLTLVSIAAFDNEARAIEATEAPHDDPSGHRKLTFPTPAAEVVGYRDQSEDRTLADYVKRTAATEGVAEHEGSTPD